MSRINSTYFVKKLDCAVQKPLREYWINIYQSIWLNPKAKEELSNFLVNVIRVSIFDTLARFS